MVIEICILDYGSGNVTSVLNSIDRLGARCKVSNQISDIRSASHFILPGVGAFGASMEKIRSRIPLDALYTEIAKGKPILGICVGMQVFAEVGFEFGEHAGLNLLPRSHVVELPPQVVKPHVGWNSIRIVRNHPITNHLNYDSDFYFVHSYVLSRIEEANVIADFEYGGNFPAIIALDNVIGVQFHPEKSQKSGELLLRNFVNL